MRHQVELSLLMKPYSRMSTIIMDLEVLEPVAMEDMVAMKDSKPGPIQKVSWLSM
jgi:hypothetical protein